MEARKTPLYEEHQRLNAKFVEFAGWKMPLEYTGIVEEHRTVRTNAGIFDVSHMGEILISGPDAVEFADYMVTNNVKKLKPGQICYTPMCNEEGGIIDDLLVYKVSVEDIMLVVNAANREKDLRWLEEHLDGYQVEVRDVSNEYVLIAFQGPKSEEMLQEISQIPLRKLKYYSFVEGRINGIYCMVSRTGYTGEDGFEIYVNPKMAITLWRRLVDIARMYGALPCGLGARDTLRLEASYLLYGSDMDESITPLECGISWTVKFQKDRFVGKEALEKRKREGIDKKLVGLVVKEGKGIPRHKDSVVKDGNEIGWITSGTKSPTLDKVIAMAYVPKALAEPGTEVEIKLQRGKILKAEIVKLPFYRGSVKTR